MWHFNISLLFITLIVTALLDTCFAIESSIGHVKIAFNNKYVIQGYYFDILCEIKANKKVSNLKLEWYHNNKKSIQVEGRWHETNQRINDDNLIAILTIDKSKKEIDTGEYVCRVLDEKTSIEARATVTVVDENEVYIGPNQKILNYKIQQIRGEIVRMIVHYEKAMKSGVFWFIPNQSQKTLMNEENFQIDADEMKSVLNIKNVTLGDSGKYVVRFQNLSKQKIEFEVTIRSEPVIYFKHENSYVDQGKMSKIEAIINGYPRPKITWNFIPCTFCSNKTTLRCNESYSENWTNNSSVNQYKNSKSSFISILKFETQNCGKVTILASNSINETTFEIEICSLYKPIYILNPSGTSKIAVGDKLTISCIALYDCNYPKAVDWFINDRSLENTDDIKVVRTQTKYFYKINLIFEKINFEHGGMYKCGVRYTEERTRFDSTEVKVHTPVAPILADSSMVDGSFIYKWMGDSVDLHCNVIAGIPRPTISWFKNNMPMIKGTNYYMERNNQTFRIQFLFSNSGGSFECVVANRLGTIKRSVQIIVSNYIGGVHVSWLAAFCVLFLVTIIILILGCIYMFKYKKKNQEIEFSKANFPDSTNSQIIEPMTLDEQAELLPNDIKKIEFPLENIHLGTPLGDGAFGIVYKAMCEGILPGKKETIVAVKMLKQNQDKDIVRAFATELKIMTYLGPHLNIVNLLGAVTKNFHKNELMVIVEYCKFGNIQNFLLKNRERFINQINPKTDLIDPKITINDIDFPKQDTNEVPKCNADQQKPSYEKFIDYIKPKKYNDEKITSNYIIWKSDHKRKSNLEISNITTSNLISWAFQIARGMDYLVAGKILHGDLAARNILLCEDNIVKICDFGMAHAYYKNENYQKNEKAKLPIKWLAIETLEERIFSIKSDVWSYGVLLWEIFSLSKIPYSGIENHMLYHKLKNGYRMEKPEYANQKLYEIMLKCWEKDPDTRPSFDELEKSFSKMLEKEVTNHYIDLNQCYLNINKE